MRSTCESSPQQNKITKVLLSVDKSEIPCRLAEEEGRETKKGATKFSHIMDFRSFTPYFSLTSRYRGNVIAGTKVMLLSQNNDFVLKVLL